MVDKLAYKRLMKTYANEFGEQPNAAVWGVASAMDTAACGAGCGASCGGKPTNNTLPPDCTMAMYFGFSKNVCVWLAGWHVTNNAQYTGTIIAILGVCALREWLTAYRQKRHQIKAALRRQRSGKEQAALINDSDNGINSTELKPPSVCEVFVESSWYALNVTLAYLLMLLIMTYNVGICLAVIGGLWLFNFLFTFLYTRQSNIDLKPADADHCCDDGTGESDGK